MTKQTDIEKTLKILQDRGAEGIHSFHLNHLVGTTRSAARINDIKNMGYKIVSRPEKLGSELGVRYFLTDSPNQPKQYTWIYEGSVARRVEV